MQARASSESHRGAHCQLSWAYRPTLAKEKPVDVTTQGATLLPAAETTIRPREPEPEEKKPSEELNVDAVFAKLKQIGGKSE